MQPEVTVPPPRPITPAQRNLICLVIALTLAGIFYRWLVLHTLTHTALLFIGFPGIIAVVVALSPPAKSATGGIVKGMTLALLLLAPLLGEGMVCILMASPIFYVVGLTIGLILDYRRNRDRRGTTLSCIAVVLVPLCLEGTTPALSFGRTETVSVTRIVAAPAAEVAASLARSPRLSTPLPQPLRVGFPVPLAATGSGSNVGDTRTLHFSGAEGAPPGDIVVRITNSAPGHLHSRIVENHTKLVQWIRPTDSTVEWHLLDATHTSVTWTLTFDRELDPAWYFIPLERAAVHEAAVWMIAANATPNASGSSR